MKEVNKTQFKVGDRVFDIRFGWGTVSKDSSVSIYKIQVTFDHGNTELYTDCGFFIATDLNPMLSYEEYTLQGFSQERPKPNFSLGELIFVKNNGVWTSKRFYKWEGKYAVCFSDGTDFSNVIKMRNDSFLIDFSNLPTIKYEEYSKEDPYKDIFKLRS